MVVGEEEEAMLGQELLVGSWELVGASKLLYLNVGSLYLDCFYLFYHSYVIYSLFAQLCHYYSLPSTPIQQLIQLATSHYSYVPFLQ